jgi:hypothetical protein
LAQLGRPRLRQRADQAHDLLARHPDTVVAHGQCAGILVDVDLDVQIRGVDLEVFVPECFEPQLVQRVGGVRDELAQERVLVAVDGVDHQIRQDDLGCREENFSEPCGGPEQDVGYTTVRMTWPVASTLAGS